MLFVFGGCVSGAALLYGQYFLQPRVQAFQNSVDFAHTGTLEPTFGYVFDTTSSDRPLAHNGKNYCLLRAQVYERLQQKTVNKKQKSSYSNQVNLITEHVTRHDGQLKVGEHNCEAFVNMFPETLLEENFEPALAGNSNVVNVNQNSNHSWWGSTETPAATGEQERVITGYIRKLYGVSVGDARPVCVFGWRHSPNMLSIHQYSVVSNDPPHVVIENEAQFANNWTKFWAVTGGISVIGFAISSIRNSQ